MIWYLPYAPECLFRAVYLPPDSTWLRAYRKRSISGEWARVVGGTWNDVNRTAVASATLAVVRRPFGCGNAAPPFLPMR